MCSIVHGIEDPSYEILNGIFLPLLIIVHENDEVLRFTEQPFGPITVLSRTQARKYPNYVGLVRSFAKDRIAISHVASPVFENVTTTVRFARRRVLVPKTLHFLSKKFYIIHSSAEEEEGKYAEKTIDEFVWNEEQQRYDRVGNISRSSDLYSTLPNTNGRSSS